MQGPKFVVGETVVRPLATRKESDGKFSVFSFEGSSFHCGKRLEETMLRFEVTHHAIRVVEGAVEVEVEENRQRRLSHLLGSRGGWWRRVFGRIGIFCHWWWYWRSMMGVGGAYEWAVVPEGGDVRAWDRGKLASLQKELSFVVLWLLL